MEEIVQLVRRDHAGFDELLGAGSSLGPTTSPAELADLLDRHHRFLDEVVWPTYEGCVGSVPDVDQVEGRAHLEEAIARLRAAEDGEGFDRVRTAFDQHAVAVEQEVLPRILAGADQRALAELTVRAMERHEELGLGASFPRPTRGAVSEWDDAPEHPAGSEPPPEGS